MTCADLLDRVSQADEQTLLMSRADCHAKNVSSIVLAKNADGSLVRAFLAWPGHALLPLKKNLWTVGVHDHKYAISLELVAGFVRNITFAAVPGEGFVEWRFRSGVESGAPSFRRVGQTALALTSISRISENYRVTLQHDTLHNIECHGAAAWIVYEGAAVKDETTLITMSSELDTSGLYRKFSSRDEVVEHCYAWRDAYLEQGE